MFYQLLFIHLFRPFLKYKRENSPLPAHVSPRKFCTHAAAMISKLLRLYKRTYGLRQICNIAVYIAHSACTIHLLNLPDKNAVRDIVHGVKHLEEIAESWLCARRTLGILETVAQRWKVTLPEEATKVLLRTKAKFDLYKHDHESPRSETTLVPAEEQNLVVPTAINYDPAFATSKGYLENGGAQAFDPPAPAQYARNDGAWPLSPRLEAEVGPTSLQPRFELPQAAPQEVWNHDRPSRGINIPPAESSPSKLFGGIQSLVEESQDWWLRDQATFFDNWYGPEQDVAFMGNENFGGYGDSGLAANAYGLNDGDGFSPEQGIL